MCDYDNVTRQRNKQVFVSHVYLSSRERLRGAGPPCYLTLGPEKALARPPKEHRKRAASPPPLARSPRLAVVAVQTCVAV